MISTIKNNKAFHIISGILEIVFLILSGIYLLWQESAATFFLLPYPDWLDETLFWCLFIIAVMRLILTGPVKKEFWIGLCLAVIYYLVYFSVGYRFLLYLAVLTAGYICIDYRKILRLWLATVGTIVCITAIAGINGIITNLIYYKDGIRSSWGFNYPTDFASIVLFLLMILWVAWRKLPDWLMLFFSIGSILLSRFIARSSTSFICGILFFIIILYHIIDQRFLSKHLRLQWVGKCVNIVSTILFPLLMILFFLLMFAYQKNMGIAVRINELMSSRISLTMNAVEEYGIHIFGTPFEMIGLGSTTFMASDYNFLDSTYALILIRYGWFLLISICLFWGWMIRKAIKCGNRKLAMIMGVIAIHSFSEHHFMDVNFNILLVMPIAVYISEGSKKQIQRTDKKKNTAAIITAGLCVLALIFVPGLFTGLKTVIQLKGLYGGGESGWILFGIIFIFLAVIVFAIWAVYQMLYGFIARCPIRKYAFSIVLFLICISAMAASVVYYNRLIDKEVRTVIIPESEQEALEIITSSAEGKVFSDLIPAVYQRRFDQIDNSVLSGSDLARFSGSTVLIDAGTEYQSFFWKNFLFTQISEEHAVYTDDQAVIAALTDSGYHLTGFYSHIDEIDLNYEAELNNLVYSEDEGLLLDGPEHPLFFGTGINLHSGKYTVTFDLSLPDDVIPASDTICSLRISDSWGEHLLQNKTVSYKDFDENGIVSISLPFSIWSDTFGIEFLVFPAEGQSVEVRKISYCRTPDYDIHTVYDSQNRSTWTHCYSLTGERTLTSDGYASVYREYDAKNRMIREEYYDTDGNPCIQSAGYCAIEQEYNKNGSLCVRRYLDSSDNLICRTDGYSVVKWEYDEEGHLLSQYYLTADGAQIDDQDLNLAIDIPDAWSEWMTPQYDILNSWFTFSYFMLGNKEIGDYYTCQFDIEFKDVTGTEGEPFVIRTQGAVDEKWVNNNIWNSDLLRLDSPPADGVYHYTVTTQISENNVDSSTFNIGFRCDNWASGSFRVNHVKIEKGYIETVWSPVT